MAAGNHLCSIKICDCTRDPENPVVAARAEPEPVGGGIQQGLALRISTGVVFQDLTFHIRIGVFNRPGKALALECTRG